jgi:trk system potassium uptake protein TrkH
MNTRYILSILGVPLLVLAGAQLLLLGWSYSLGDAHATSGFAAGAGLATLSGAGLRLVGRSEGDLYRREGVLIVVGTWFLASIVGAIPYFASGVLASPVDALFESASGFTTTGATVLQNIEAAGHPILLWRSFTQWLGGIGIVVLFVALISKLGPGARFLYKLEVPGPRAEILHAHVRDTALAMGRIYLVLTIVEIFVLLACGLGFFDALTTSFSTVSTGGFSPHSSSIAAFSIPAQIVVLVFMIAAGVNFSLYLLASRRLDLSAFRDLEFKAYLATILLFSFAVAAVLLKETDLSAIAAWVGAAFQVVSILTTTGFTTADFAGWPNFASSLLVFLMVFGGCAGSTAGGLKIVRGIIGWRAVLREVRLTFSPNSVIAVFVQRDAVPEESVRSVVALLVIWLLSWGVGAVLLTAGDTDIVTAATASISMISNVGPGLGAAGPTENFAHFASWQKLLMVFLMWCGRLEFFSLLALLQRRFWRK